MNLISEWKKDTGMSYLKMAYRLGISAGHCCQITKGKAQATPHLLKRLEKVKEFEKEIKVNPEAKKEYLEFLNS